MTKKLLLLIMLLSVLMYAGCGGGSGGGVISILPTTTTTGAIQGTVSIASDSASSSSFNNSSLNSSINFPKVPLRKSQFPQQSLSNEQIIKLRPGLNDSEAAQIIASLGGTIKKKLYGTESTFLITVNDQTFSKSSAIQNSNIEYVEDNLKFQAFADLNDPYLPLWNYDMINLPAAWDEQKGSPNVIVAVIDTGISLNHEDLSANLVPGYDFVDDDSDPSDTEYYDEDNQYSHGTHVAGIISAVANNGKGIAGVAWNVKIMPIRALGSNGMGHASDIIEGINWAVSHGANVINLSLGIKGVSPSIPGFETFKAAIDNAINSGVTVIAAAGNEAPEYPDVCFPANYGPVIAVSALDETGVKASYSCYGPEIDLCAPGGKGAPITFPLTQMIFSTTYDKLNQKDAYIFMSGTSMACPHVSGVVALLYSKGLTNPIDIERVLKSTAKNLNNPNYYGAGMVDAYAALTGITTAVNVFYYKLPDTTTASSFYKTSVNGYYVIPNLQPGQYIVCAFLDQDNSGDVSSGDLFDISNEITVTVGSTTTVNFVLKKYTEASSVTLKEHFQSLLSSKN